MRFIVCVFDCVYLQLTAAVLLPVEPPLGPSGMTSRSAQPILLNKLRRVRQLEEEALAFFQSERETSFFLKTHSDTHGGRFAGKAE